MRGVVGGLGHRVSRGKVVKVHGIRGGVLGVVRVGRGCVVQTGSGGRGHIAGLDLHLNQSGRATGGVCH